MGGWVGPGRCSFVEPARLLCAAGSPPAGVCLREHRLWAESQGPGVSFGPLANPLRILHTWIYPAAQSMTAGGARNCCVCAAECWKCAGHRRLPENSPMLFVAPKRMIMRHQYVLCGYRLQLARGLRLIATRTWPNSNPALPVAGAICPSGIARCCVLLCICGLQLVRMQAGAWGGGSIYMHTSTCCDTTAENFTTQRHSRRQ